MIAASHKLTIQSIPHPNAKLQLIRSQEDALLYLRFVLQPQVYMPVHSRFGGQSVVLLALEGGGVDSAAFEAAGGRHVREERVVLDGLGGGRQ